MTYILIVAFVVFGLVVTIIGGNMNNDELFLFGMSVMVMGGFTYLIVSEIREQFNKLRGDIKGISQKSSDAAEQK